eukprot:CFRG6120T1
MRNTQTRATVDPTTIKALSLALLAHLTSGSNILRTVPTVISDENFSLIDFNVDVNVWDSEEKIVHLTVILNSVHGVLNIDEENVPPSQIVFMSSSYTQRKTMFVVASNRVQEYPPDFDRDKGDIFKISWVFSDFSEAGAWNIVLFYLADAKGNVFSIPLQTLQQNGFDTSFTVNEDVGRVDVSPPHLVDIKIMPSDFLVEEYNRNNHLYNSAPDIITVGVDRNITFQLTISDDMSGLARSRQKASLGDTVSYIMLTSRTSPEIGGQTAIIDIIPRDHLKKGNTSEGTYVVTVPLETHAWPGEWELSVLVLVDAVGNVQHYTREEMDKQLRFDARFNIHNYNMTFMWTDPFHYIPHSIYADEYGFLPPAQVEDYEDHDDDRGSAYVINLWQNLSLPLSATINRSTWETVSFHMKLAGKHTASLNTRVCSINQSIFYRHDMVNDYDMMT